MKFSHYNSSFAPQVENNIITINTQGLSLAINDVYLRVLFISTFINKLLYSVENDDQKIYSYPYLLKSTKYCFMT